MDALFIELPAFERFRAAYLSDDAFTALQVQLLRNPDAGAVIQGVGGLRKLRFVDDFRHKGKRGGIRIIYYWWDGGAQFWLFTLYGKDEQADLSSAQRKLLKQRLEQELAARAKHET
ncbi:toxin [Pseudomonas sp. 1239]|uniref:toxin n=1 Tax=unclassified Pseudomonas TaxID=196821 RepID=UPI000B4EC76C|nr:toxin [Pseudomonas sp. 1239]OUM32112.1 toxin [Pseudomonas sp. 1239]